MHSETFHPDKGDPGIQFEEDQTEIDDDADLLSAKGICTLKNKLVKCCPQTHVDNFHTTAEQRKNEKLSESCPQTTRDHTLLAEKREIRKLSDSCPCETTRGRRK